MHVTGETLYYSIEHKTNTYLLLSILILFIHAHRITLNGVKNTNSFIFEYIALLYIGKLIENIPYKDRIEFPLKFFFLRSIKSMSENSYIFQFQYSRVLYYE